MTDGTGITGGDGGSEGAALTISLDYSNLPSLNPALGAGATTFADEAQGGVFFEGDAADENEGLLTTSILTTDRTWTLPDTGGEITLLGQTISGSEVSDGLATRVVTQRIGGLSGSDDRFLLVAPSTVEIVQVSLVSDTPTSGSFGSDQWEFMVRNLTDATNLMSSRKVTSDFEISADTPYDLNPDQNTVLSANDVVELQITKSGTPTDLSTAEIIVQVEYTVSN